MSGSKETPLSSEDVSCPVNVTFSGRMPSIDTGAIVFVVPSTFQKIQ